MFTLTSLLMGVAAYVVTEAFAWVNKKATGTPFQGIASWLVVAVVCLVVGYVKQFFFSGVPLTWADFATASAAAFLWSQGLFTTAQVFLGKLLQVQPTTTTTTA